MKKSVLVVLVWCLTLVNIGPHLEKDPIASTSEIGQEDEQESKSVLPARLESHHLENLVRVHSRIVTGATPEDYLAFEELKKMGVTTIISVDGLTPNIDLASEHGLRYVHLPLGYDGISKQRLQELAKAIRYFEGSIYIHCHLGEHRGPAAAAAASIAAGLISQDEALATLEIAGTNPKYLGLHHAVQNSTPYDESLLQNIEVDFKPIAKVSSTTEAMVNLSQALNSLEQFEQASWKESSQTEFDPTHQALLMRELFAEMLRSKEVESESAEYRELLGSAMAAAKELEDALGEQKQTETPSPSSAELSKQLAKIKANCQNCHTQFRN